MNNNIKLSDKVFQCRIASEKAKLVVGMLADDYGFSESNEEEGRERMMREADTIITYLFIALDYISATDTELKQLSQLLDVLPDSKEETTEDLLSLIESFKVPEQCDLIVDEMQKIIDKNNRALFETSSDCFTAGFIRGQEFEKSKRKKVQP